jgi:hypothetical protein
MLPDNVPSSDSPRQPVSPKNGKPDVDIEEELFSIDHRIKAVRKATERRDEFQKFLKQGLLGSIIDEESRRASRSEASHSETIPYEIKLYSSSTPLLADLGDDSDSEEKVPAIDEKHRDGLLGRRSASPSAIGDVNASAGLEPVDGADNGGTSPDDDKIDLRADGSRWAKRQGAFLGGLTGALYGALAGLLVGSAVPGIGHVVGLVAGAVMGGYGAAGGAALGTLGGGLWNRLRGGQGQQEHVWTALKSLDEQGVRLSPAELQRLLPPKALQKQFPQAAQSLPAMGNQAEQPLKEWEWRKHLHAARGDFPATPGGLTKQGARQAYREAFLLTVAKQGRQAALNFRRELLAPREEVGDQAVAPEERGDKALDQIELLGGNKALRKAHYSVDRVNALARVRQEQDDNRAAWQAYGTALEGQFMAPRGLKDEFLARNAFKKDHGYPIPDKTKQRWWGVAKYEAAVADLSERVRESRDKRGLDPISELHKQGAVDAQREAFKDKDRTMPSEMLIHGGRLNEAETRRVLEPWWQAQQEASISHPHRVNKPPAFERVMARGARADRVRGDPDRHGRLLRDQGCLADRPVQRSRPRRRPVDSSAEAGSGAAREAPAGSR